MIGIVVPNFHRWGIGLRLGVRWGNIYVWNITDPDNPLVLKGHTDDSRVSTFLQMDKD